MTKFVACGDFVRRQTKNSSFSHFNGSWEELEDLVSANFQANHYRNGYRKGVYLVDIPQESCHVFYTSIIALNSDSKLKASYSSRRIGEAPFIKVGAEGEKQEAKYVSVVLYSADVLRESGEDPAGRYEIVAIKARVSVEEEPMPPVTMARNFLQMEGGTKGDFSADDFAKSIIFWNNHAMAVPKKNWFSPIKKWLYKALSYFYYEALRY